MAINQKIREELPEDAVIFDNKSYDNSIIGVTSDGRVVYDFDLMVAELMKDENWTEDEAVEWIEYNTIWALSDAEESTPIVMYRIETNTD